MSIINIFLDGFFQIINYILFVILVLLSIKLFIKTYNLIKKYKDNSKEIKDFKRINYSNKYIEDFSIEEFKLWCSNSLKKQGYYNLKNKFGYQYLLCSKNNSDFLVYCCNNSNKVITVNTLRYILGVMVVEDISNSILISSTNLSKSVKNFIETLPNEYTLEFINLADLHNKVIPKNPNILQQT